MARRYASLLGGCALGILLSGDRALAAMDEPLPKIAPPLLLRLEGVLHETADAARATGFAAVSLGFLDDETPRTRWLAVTDARTLGGDHPLDGKDVLAILSPLTPNLLVTGPTAIVAPLRRAPTGALVRTEGLVHRGSRTYYLRSVEVGGEPAAR